MMKVVSMYMMKMYMMKVFRMCIYDENTEGIIILLRFHNFVANLHFFRFPLTTGDRC